MRISLLLIGLSLHTAAAAVPQMPLASGQIDAILPAIKAAHRCGVYYLRIAPGRNGLVMLYIDRSPPLLSATRCAERWITANARRLHLRLGYQTELE